MTSSSTSGSAVMNVSLIAATTEPTVASSSRAGITTLIRIPWPRFQLMSWSTGQSCQCDVRRRNQASARSSGLATGGQEDHRTSRRGLLVVLIEDINLKDDDVLPIFLPFSGNDAARSQHVVLVVNGAELQCDLADLRLVADPGSQRIEHVGPSQVTHAERTTLARGPPGLFIHVDIDEFVIDGGIAIPAHEVCLAYERGDRLANLNVLVVQLGAHDVPQVRLVTDDRGDAPLDQAVILISPFRLH